MSTIVPFIPSTTTRFKFPAQFDNGKYTVEVSWNVSAQRYYIDVYGADGAWVITTALVQSPPARALEKVVYDPFRLALIYTMVDPTLWPVPLSSGGLNTKPGILVDYTIEGFQPTTYNGTYRGLHINEVTFSIPWATDPGSYTIIGSVSRYLNMVATVFNTSSLIYRNGAFEVNP